MPKQFYLTADPAPYTPATWHGGWNETDDAVDLLLDSTKTTAAIDKFTIQSVSSPVTNSSVVFKRVALARFVSGPMLAQTIQGTMQIMAGVVSSAVAGRLHYSIHAWATVGDSDTERGVLLNQFRELLSSNNPFPIDPRGRDMMVSAALNAVTIHDNDRLVIEVGYISYASDGIEYTGTLYYGTDFYSNGSPDMVRN